MSKSIFASILAFSALIVVGCSGDALVEETPANGSADEQDVVSTDVDAFVLPAPSGSYAIGVTDFEYVDQSREEGFAPGTKRRLMARVWYPADQPVGAPRPYLSEQEYQFRLESAGTNISPTPVDSVHSLKDVMTHSYPDSEISNREASFPLLVFSHGGYGSVGTNTVQMEHLASNGYIVVSVTHPYLSAPILYPNGDVVRPDEPFLKKFIDATVSDPNYFDWMIEPDFGKRLEVVTKQLTTHPLVPHFLIWRDDMIAIVDVIERGNFPEHVRPVLAKADINRLGYFGMSFGAAAIIAAHSDKRAKAGISLDGGVWDATMINAEIRSPVMIMHHDGALSTAAYQLPHPVRPHSDFLLERFETFGSRPDVVRIEVAGATHSDFTDFSMQPSRIRTKTSALGLSGTINGTEIQVIMNDFVKGFFDRYVLGDEDAFPADLYERYEAAEKLNRTEIADWADSKNQ